MLKVYVVYIDCEMKGIFETLEMPTKLLDRRKKEDNYWQDDSWIDTIELNKEL